MTAGAAATGMRVWMVSYAGAWLTPRRRTLLTRAILVLAVLTAAVLGPSAA